MAKAGVDGRTIKKLSKELGSANDLTRMEDFFNKDDKFKGKNYNESTMKAIRQAFDKANTSIYQAKDLEKTKTGSRQILSDKYKMGDIDEGLMEQYLSLAKYDLDKRFGEGSDPEEKEEKYQDNVVTLLTELNNNMKLGLEYFSGKRNTKGRIVTRLDEDGNPIFERIGQGEISQEEALAGYKSQRNVAELGRDVKSATISATEKVIDTVAEPVKDVVSGAFDIIKKNSKYYLHT